MPNLFLVRHCEPEITGVLLGQSDPALSASGRSQAAKLLHDVPLARIYSSPLRRALETARIVAQSRVVDILEDLREITYGIWDGRSWSEIESFDSNLAAKKIADWQSITPPGGEPWPAFVDRVRRAFDHIQSGPLPAAIVTHAAVIQVISKSDLPYGGIYELSLCPNEAATVRGSRLTP